MRSLGKTIVVSTVFSFKTCVFQLGIQILKTTGCTMYYLIIFEIWGPPKRYTTLIEKNRLSSKQSRRFHVRFSEKTTLKQVLKVIN